jgi:hypothetical protein
MLDPGWLFNQLTSCAMPLAMQDRKQHLNEHNVFYRAFRPYSAAR